MSLKPVHVVGGCLLGPLSPLCSFSFFLLRLLLERWCHFCLFTLFSFSSSLPPFLMSAGIILRLNIQLVNSLCIQCFLAHSKDGGRDQARECEAVGNKHKLKLFLQGWLALHLCSRLSLAQGHQHSPQPNPPASWVPVETLPEGFSQGSCYLAENSWDPPTSPPLLQHLQPQDPWGASSPCMVILRPCWPVCGSSTQSLQPLLVLILFSSQQCQKENTKEFGVILLATNVCQY